MNFALPASNLLSALCPPAPLKSLTFWRYTNQIIIIIIIIIIYTRPDAISQWNGEMSPALLLFAGGLNHSGCCASVSVPVDCLSMCSGSVVRSSLHAACLPHVHSIVSCLRQALGTCLSSAVRRQLIMVALCNRADHYIFALWFLSSSSSFFLFSPNLSGCRLDVYHTSTHGVALVRI